MDTKKVETKEVTKKVIDANEKKKAIILNHTFMIIDVFAELETQVACELSVKYGLLSKDFNKKMAIFAEIRKDLKAFRKILVEPLPDSTSFRESIPTIFKYFFPVFKKIQELRFEDDLAEQDPTIFQDAEDDSLAFHNFLTELLIEFNFSDL